MKSEHGIFEVIASSSKFVLTSQPNSPFCKLFRIDETYTRPETQRTQPNRSHSFKQFKQISKRATEGPRRPQRQRARVGREGIENVSVGETEQSLPLQRVAHHVRQASTSPVADCVRMCPPNGRRQWDDHLIVRRSMPSCTISHSGDIWRSRSTCFTHVCIA